MKAGILFLLAIAFLGCASLKRVDRERCLNLDVEQMGYEDGREGQRSQGRLDFWKKDCKAYRVELDEQKYQSGFTRGRVEFCSCEKGFLAAAKKQYVEIQPQYFVCKKVEMTGFQKGYDLADVMKTKDEWIKSKNQIETVYNEEIILKEAQQTCQNQTGS